MYRVRHEMGSRKCPVELELEVKALIVRLDSFPPRTSWILDGTQIFIKDVKSSNGTFVNGERLSAEGHESEPYELKSEDHVVSLSEMNAVRFKEKFAESRELFRNSESIS